MRVDFWVVALWGSDENKRWPEAQPYHSLRNSLAAIIWFSGAGHIWFPRESLFGSTLQ
jgi:hypothetical protein